MSKNTKETAVDFIFNHLKDKHPEVFKTLRDDNIYYLAKVMERDIIIESVIYDHFLAPHPRLVGVEYYKRHFGDLEPPN